MMQETTYKNRYSEEIKFKHLDDKTIEMSNYYKNFRVGYKNDYDEAYNTYLNSTKLSKEEFIKKIHAYGVDHFIDTYGSLVKTTKIVNMVDPSGGPYIELGSNLRFIFGDEIDRIVESIEIKIDTIIFKIK